MCLGFVDDTPLRQAVRNPIKGGECTNFSHLDTIMDKVYRRERKLRTLQSHLDGGTFPKCLGIKTFPRLKTSQGQAIIEEACNEVKQLILIQMIEEQRFALAQTQKEVKSCPLEMIKTLRKEIKSLRAKLKQAEREKTEVVVKQEEPEN